MWLCGKQPRARHVLGGRSHSWSYRAQGAATARAAVGWCKAVNVLAEICRQRLVASESAEKQLRRAIVTRGRDSRQSALLAAVPSTLSVPEQGTACIHCATAT